MLIYLLKMIACSAAFYGLYVLLFKNEKMFVFNRFYLLGSLLLSFFIPFITITVDAPVMPSTVMTLNERVVVESQVPSVPEVSLGSYVIYVAMLISVIVSSVLLMRLVLNYLKLKRVAKQGQQLYIDHVQVVLLDQPLTPHSFLNTIFLNREEYDSGRVEEEVIQHEIAHIQQKHSWDIFLIECLQAFTWFNPVIYLYKRSIKINHELLADAAVVKQLDNMRSYQYILLQRAGAQPSLALASSFHFFITKKRIIMLQKKANPVMAGLKATVSLPLLALLVVVFSERVYAQVEKSANPTSPSLNVKSTIDGASAAELTEYQDILNSYKKVNGKVTTQQLKFSEQDRSRLEEIFQKMSKIQQEEQTIAFVKSPNPLEKSPPSASNYEKWKNAKMYGVWIDNKRVSNSTLNNYTSADFSQASVSRLSKNAVNYGKHYVQVDLMTHTAYESYYKAAIADKNKLVMVHRIRKHVKQPNNTVTPSAADHSTPLPDNIETIRVKEHNGKKSIALIRYKNGEEVSGDISTSEKEAAFEKKYGIKLPPPPPPPARKKKMVPPPPPQPAIVKVKVPLPPPAAPLPPKKVRIVSPPHPPKPKKSEQVISFTPPVIVKDKKTNEASVKHQEPAVAATKQLKRFAPPVIVKDDVVHKTIKESLPAEGVDKSKNN